MSDKIQQKVWKSNTTFYDRYPSIFYGVSKLFPFPSKILSFGCSSGKEIKTLREKYYIDESIAIDGIDISKSIVEKAKQYLKGMKNINIYNYEDFIYKEQNYDIIFVLNCLCHYKKGIEEWEELVCDIIKMIKLNGAIIIHNSTYDIEKTKLKNYLNRIVMPDNIMKEIIDNNINQKHFIGFVNNNKECVCFTRH